MLFSLDVILKSNLSEPGVKKLIKKKLIWADEQNQPLVNTSIFEVDESEMVDMHAFARQCAANISIAQLEKLMERDLCQRRNLPKNQSIEMDDRPNLAPLPKLIRILLPETIPNPVVKSQERNEQEEREKTVLQALLMRSFLPHSPGEPDGDLHGQISNERIEPKTIPLDDVRIRSNQYNKIWRNRYSSKREFLLFNFEHKHICWSRFVIDRIIDSIPVGLCVCVCVEI